MIQTRNAYNILVGKPERKRPLARHKRRLEDNIRMDLLENSVTRCGLEAHGSEQGPMASFCVHGNELSGSIKGGKFLK
jgi:hypothetical protein